MDLAASRRLGKVVLGLAGVGPGGMRDGRILRFAETGTHSAVGGICIMSDVLAR